MNLLRLRWKPSLQIPTVGLYTSTNNIFTFYSKHYLQWKYNNTTNAIYKSKYVLKISSTHFDYRCRYAHKIFHHSSRRWQYNIQNFTISQSIYPHVHRKLPSCPYILQYIDHSSSIIYRTTYNMQLLKNVNNMSKDQTWAIHFWTYRIPIHISILHHLTLSSKDCCHDIVPGHRLYRSSN